MTGSGILGVTPSEPATPPAEPPAETPPEVPTSEAPKTEVQCTYCNDTKSIVHGGVIPCPYCTEEGIAKYGLLALDPAKLDEEAQKGYVESRRVLGI